MYVARNPSKTDLHCLIRENFRQVFFDKEIQGVHLPFHLEREFRKYLTCGIMAFGMVRFHCSCCKKDKFVAFSCKGRTLCPSCTGRRMADTAKHLVEEVIPAVPVGQWVRVCLILTVFCWQQDQSFCDRHSLFFIGV